MHGTPKREPLNGAILFDDVGAALKAFGWDKPVSAQHQVERNAWQREASMSESERKAAYEARYLARRQEAAQ